LCCALARGAATSTLHAVAVTDPQQDTYGPFNDQVTCFTVSGRRLIRFVDGQPVPDLLTSWEQEGGDGATWSFELAPDAVLADGRRFDASFFVDILSDDPDDPFSYETVAAVDHTVTVELRYPKASRYFLQYLASRSSLN
jgi:ABC-type transport system substrate-binding protein